MDSAVTSAVVFDYSEQLTEIHQTLGTIEGFLLFFVLCILMYGVYRFFRIFF